MSDFKKHIDRFVSMEMEKVHGKKVLNAEQTVIFRSVMSEYGRGGVGVIQGTSGSGKTTLISAIKKYCDSKSISCAITASTGKAASAIGGVTMHSYIGLSMQQNDDADKIEDALQLKQGEKEFEIPDIIICDEMSMIGQNLLRTIRSQSFKYILFVGDMSQLPPVKDKAVDWKEIATSYYELKRTMRTKEPALLKVFDDFKKQKHGELSDLDIFDYVDGDKIVEVDYQFVDKMEKNSPCTFVAYRNKLVEHMADRLTSDGHNIFNLNVGVIVTAMKVVYDHNTKKPIEYNGFIKREFKNEPRYFNGEDVQIIELKEETKKLVSNGFVKYKNWFLKKTKAGILIVDNNTDELADNYFISFPQNLVLDHCVLSLVGGDTFSLVWQEGEIEFNNMLQYYFAKLRPYLKVYQSIKHFWNGKKYDDSILTRDVKYNFQHMGKEEFFNWYDVHAETVERKKGWKNLLTAKGVVSARPTTSRTIHKCQGISTPAVVLSAASFFGASDNAKYVAVSRAKHGIILIRNVPETWKEK